MTLTGWIDVAQRTRVMGWARRADLPDNPVELTISVAPTLRDPARPVATILANGYRADLDPDATGYQGRAGFDIDLRDFSLPEGSFVLDVRDAATGVRVPGGPHFIAAASFDPGPTPLLLFELDRRPVIRLPDDVAPCMPLQDGIVHVELPPRATGIMICTQVRRVRGDARRLGAVLSHVEIDGAPVDLTSDGFAFGFYAVEGEPGRAWRWMDGAAYVGIGAHESVVTVALHVRGLAEPARVAIDRDPQWQISARYHLVPPSNAALPSIAARFLGRPVSPEKRRVAVRGAAGPATRQSPISGTGSTDEPPGGDTPGDGFGPTPTR